MTMHDTWKDTEARCDRCGMHWEDEGHTKDICSLGSNPRPQGELQPIIDRLESYGDGLDAPDPDDFYQD